MTSQYGRRRSAAIDEGGADYLQKRKDISAAAGRVFKSKGLHATKVSDIAIAAEVDRATFYYYFASKEAVFEEVVDAAVEANAEQAVEIRRGPGTAPEKLRTLIVALMRSYADAYPYLYVFIQENLTQLGKSRPEWSERLRGLNHTYEDAVIGIIQDGIADGSLRTDDDPRTIAYGLLGMLGWTNRWFSPNRSHQSAEQIGNTFANIFLDGLAARRN